MGSRNGHAALFLWHSLREKGIGGIRADVEYSMQMARLLRDELRAAGISANLNALSSTVVMERPACPDFILRWQLACEVCHLQHTLRRREYPTPERGLVTDNSFLPCRS